MKRNAVNNEKKCELGILTSDEVVKTYSKIVLLLPHRHNNPCIGRFSLFQVYGIVAQPPYRAGCSAASAQTLLPVQTLTLRATDFIDSHFLTKKDTITLNGKLVVQFLKVQWSYKQTKIQRLELLISSTRRCNACVGGVDNAQMPYKKQIKIFTPLLK